jgi:hypothetical protein
LVSTWSESRVSILTDSKPKSLPLRNYQQLHNQSLDSWDSLHSQEILSSFKTTNLNSLNLDSFKTQFLKKFLAVATPSIDSQKILDSHEILSSFKTQVLTVKKFMGMSLWRVWQTDRQTFFKVGFLWVWERDDKGGEIFTFLLARPVCFAHSLHLQG